MNEQQVANTTVYWYADWGFWTLVVTVVFSLVGIYLRLRKEQQDRADALERKLEAKASKEDLQQVKNTVDDLPSKDYVDKQAGRARGTADQAMQKAEVATSVREEVLGMVTKMATDSADTNTKIAEVKAEISDKYVKKDEFNEHKRLNSEQFNRLHNRVDRLGGGFTHHD